MANAAGIVNVGQYGCEANYEGHHHGVCFSCELISADCHLTQSTEMTAWAVTQIQHQECQLISADCCLSQSAQLSL